VYLHIRNESVPFYVGIGRKANFQRAFEKKGRNSIWRAIFNKSIVDSNVIYTNLTWNEACEIEKTLIDYFGRIDKNTGTLANLTDGGDGNSGAIFTIERRMNISKALTGKKLSQAHIEKLKQRTCTESTKEKIRLLKIGNKASEATKEKMRTTNLVGILACTEAIKKKVIDTVSGQVFSSVREAAKHLGYSNGHVSGMLLGRYKNTTNLKYGSN
jgi:hypothetical protein